MKLSRLFFWMGVIAHLAYAIHLFTHSLFTMSLTREGIQRIPSFSHELGLLAIAIYVIACILEFNSR